MAANLLLNGSFEVDANSDGLADSWTISENVAGAPTKALSTAGAKYGTYAQRIAHTSTGDTSKQVSLFQASVIGSFAATDPAAVSVWLSGSATGCLVQLRCAAYTAAAGYLGIATLTITPTSTPTLYSKVYASLPANTSYCTMDVLASVIDTGDTFDLYIDGAKLEKSATATPFATPPWAIRALAGHSAATPASGGHSGVSYASGGRSSAAPASGGHSTGEG